MPLLLLSVTAYGWSFIGLMVLSAWVTYKFVQRMWPGERKGCVTYGYVWLVVFIISSLLFTFTGVFVKSVYAMYTKPKYKAVVVDVSGHTDKDSKGRRITMYTPIVAFTDNSNRKVTIETDISSSGKQRVGDIIRVAYASGDSRAADVSGTGIGMMIGLFVMLFIMGFVFFAAFRFAAGKDMSSVVRFGAGVLTYFIFPGVMLFFLAGLGYALYQYFTGQKPDMPFWAVGVCCFFVLVLLLAIPGYFKMMIEKNKDSNPL